MASAEKLSLRINCAEVVALTFTDGFKVQSNFGNDQVLYSLEDGRKLYADLPLAEAIEAAGIKARQPFEIVKRSPKSYEVRPVQRTGVRQSEARVTEATPQPARAIVVNGPTIPETTPERNQHSAVAGNDPLARRLMASLFIAIDAAREAEAYAARHKMLIQFSAEDIRALANTAFIQAHKGGF